MGFREAQARCALAGPGGSDDLVAGRPNVADAPGAAAPGPGKNLSAGVRRRTVGFGNVQCAVSARTVAAGESADDFLARWSDVGVMAFSIYNRVRLNARRCHDGPQALVISNEIRWGRAILGGWLSLDVAAWKRHPKLDGFRSGYGPGALGKTWAKCGDRCERNLARRTRQRLPSRCRNGGTARK